MANEYSNYIAQQIDNNITYTDYIAQQLDNITYTDYIAQQIDNMYNFKKPIEVKKEFHFPTIEEFIKQNVEV